MTSKMFVDVHGESIHRSFWNTLKSYGISAVHHTRNKSVRISARVAGTSFTSFTCKEECALCQNRLA